MGRPAGTKNKAKASGSGGKSAPRKAGRKQAAAGAPSPARTETPPARKMTNGPTATQLQDWLTEATELDTASSRIRQKQSTLKKNIESGGADYKAFKALFRSSKLSKNEATEALEAVVAYHRSLNIRVSFDPYSGQGSMDDVLGDGQPSRMDMDATARLKAARAHGDGYNSGRNGGVPHDNPFSHAPGSEEYVQWLKGRDDGQLDRELNTPGMADRLEAAKNADGTLPDAPLF